MPFKVVRVCTVSVSPFLCVSENMVASQHTHVAVGPCARNKVEPLKERKFRYCGGVCGSVCLHFHCGAAF